MNWLHQTYIKIVFILLVLLSSVSVYGQGQGGTEDNMSILGYGARALGLGKAFTALADDPTAVYWNPAGLEDIYQQQATFFHVSLWEGTSLDYLGYVYPTIDIGSFGIGIGRIGVGDIPQTNSGEEVLGTFSNAEYQFYLGFGTDGNPRGFRRGHRHPHQESEDRQRKRAGLRRCVYRYRTPAEHRTFSQPARDG